MKVGIQIGFLWNDNHLVEVRITGWNGRFGGTTDVYLPLDGLLNTADQLDSFPRDKRDQREIQFGPVKGKATLRFFCEGESGRSFVELWMETPHDNDGCAENVSPEAVRLHAPVEAGALDTFVAELRQVHANFSGVASLSFASQGT